MSLQLISANIMAFENRWVLNNENVQQFNSKEYYYFLAMIGYYMHRLCEKAGVDVGAIIHVLTKPEIPEGLSEHFTSVMEELEKDFNKTLSSFSVSNWST